MTSEVTGESPVDGGRSSLGTRAARKLATTTKTVPQMHGITSRWLLRKLPWVEVSSGTYRVNRRLTLTVGRGRVAFVQTGADDVRPVCGRVERSAPLREALQDDLVLRMFDSAVAHLSRHATPAQVQRACYSTFAMFVSWTAYAAWRETGEHPPAWEYLAARHHDSFYTSMTLIDIVGGYEVPAGLFYEPRVRRAAMQAGTASVIVNDLHSVAKDAADEKPVCNLVLLIATDRDCSVEEATEITVALHNDLVRDFESSHRELATVPSPELQRFLRGLRAWMGGGFEWHATNPRYAAQRP